MVQVESFFIKNGYLIPSFHKNYWIGLTTQKTGGRPNWYWWVAAECACCSPSPCPPHTQKRAFSTNPSGARSLQGGP